MTHLNTKQPEALRLARKFEEVGFMGDHRFAKDHWCRQAAAELRSQHARIKELEDVADMAIKRIAELTEETEAAEMLWPLKLARLVISDVGKTLEETFAPAQPVAQQGAVDGFFLLLPQRPKPEAPARTAGLDWDAYSGAQMLAFGRDCSDAAIAALRAQQPAPEPQGWKLVPVNLLERIQESLGSFVSDQGWSQSDIDTADALDGLLARDLIEDTDLDDEAFDDFAEDVDESECHNCSGTGEGMYDSQSCVVCLGKGFL